MKTAFRDSIASDDAANEYIITGGVDDLVKVWELEDDHLKMKYQLEGHSLGVVSVAVSNDGKRKLTIKVLMECTMDNICFSMCI